MTFHEVDELTKGDLAVWRHRPGGSYYWEVDFLGKDAAESLRLCSGFCIDLEPGHESDGARFNSLPSTATAVIGGRNTIILQGTVNIGASASIATASAGRWVSPNLSLGGFLDDTPKPSRWWPAATPFTLAMRVAPPHARRRCDRPSSSAGFSALGCRAPRALGSRR